MYPVKDLIRAKYDLLKPTNMTDYTANLWKEIHDSDDIPEEFIEKREHVLTTLQKLEEESQKVLSVLEDQEVISALRQDKTQNLQYLKEHHGVFYFEVYIDSRLRWTMLMCCINLDSFNTVLPITVLQQIFCTIFEFWYFFLPMFD